MITASNRSAPARLLRWGGLSLAAFLLLVITPPARAAEPPSRSPRTAQLTQPKRGAVLPAGPRPVLGATVWKGFTSFLDKTLNSRRRMLQFATIGMCLALYIMIWRR